jgi:hypothetical protein
MNMQESEEDSVLAEMRMEEREEPKIFHGDDRGDESYE